MHRMHHSLLPYVLLPLFLVLVFGTYYQHIGAFGCFDDCHTFVTSYFMVKGKALYSEIFSNHQMNMPYLSYLVQKLLRPATVYTLVLYHRLVLMAFAFLMDLLLIARFGLVGFFLALLYETTKFYLFGDRFLGESFIPYALSYTFGLLWYKLHRQRLFFFDYILSALFTWFIVFTREPYIPIALLVFALLLFRSRIRGAMYASLLTFFLLSSLTLLSVPLSDYFFNVLSVNASVEVKQQTLFGSNVLEMFGYPVLLLFAKQTNHFHLFLIGVTVVFLIAITTYMVIEKRWRVVLLLIGLLGIANLRVVPAGTVFYESFHMLPWYALFLLTTLFLLERIASSRRLKPLFYGCVFLLTIFLVAFVLHPQSVFREKVDSNVEFTTNYAHYFVYGEAIKQLAKGGKTLFVDGFDELIHWQADLPSSYRYSSYTSVMPYFPIYREAREAMFRKNPPDFYYGSCPADVNPQRQMPQASRQMYKQFTIFGKPSCLYVKKTLIPSISEEQWEKAKQLGFTL